MEKEKSIYKYLIAKLLFYIDDLLKQIITRREKTYQIKQNKGNFMIHLKMSSRDQIRLGFLEFNRKD